MAVQVLRSQAANQLVWLGAEPGGARWHLPVMDDVFRIDIRTGSVRSGDGTDVQATWGVLALHYLAVPTRPAIQPPAITFASLPSARTYAVVYENRVNRRFCAGAGRNAESLQSAAANVGAQRVEGGDLAFEMLIFPRIPMRLIWYAQDDELPPACTLLLPPNIESFLCVEDVVVMSESVIARLNGKKF